MGEDGAESPPPSPDDADRSPGKVCDHCGSAIDTTEWYPVTNERGPDGSIRLYDFCSEDCRDAWLDGSGG